MKILRSEAGFTLIELVLIVVILGILAAVATIQFGTIIADSRSAAIDGAFGPYNAQLALAINSQKKLPTTNDAVACPGTAGSFKAEVFCRTSLSGGVTAGTYIAGAASDTFILTPSGGGATCQGTVTFTGATGALTIVKAVGGC